MDGWGCEGVIDGDDWDAAVEEEEEEEEDEESDDPGWEVAELEADWAEGDEDMEKLESKRAVG
jgi:hypothetical protein